jgi:hypothetical protein
MRGQAGELFRITGRACFQQLKLNSKAIENIQRCIEPRPASRTGYWIKNNA